MNSEYLVEVQDLKQYFPVKTGFMKNTYLKAVDGVSFAIRPGETLGLVGESGCGKTTVGRTLLRLYEPTGGKVLFNGEEVTNKNITALRKEMQMVFQDPYSSLDPRMTVEDIIGEPLDVHLLCSFTDGNLLPGLHGPHDRLGHTDRPHVFLYVMHPDKGSMLLYTVHCRHHCSLYPLICRKIQCQSDDGFS